MLKLTLHMLVLPSLVYDANGNSLELHIGIGNSNFFLIKHSHEWIIKEPI